METRRSIKILVLGSLFTCSCIFANAQDYYGNGGNNGSWRRQPSNNNHQKRYDTIANEPSGYISINFGFSNPEGNFGQSYSQNNFGDGPAVGIGYGNYASPGSAFHFSLGIPINHSNFGVALMFGSYDNDYNTNAYATSLNASPINYNPYSSSPNTPPSSIIAYQSGGGLNTYDESSIMGGLFATYPVGRLSIDGRLMLGALLCNLPEQDITAVDADDDYLEYDIEPSNSTSLAFDIGVGARFMIAQLGRRKLCIMVNADYLYSSVSYTTQQDLYVNPASGPNAGYTAQLVPSPQISGKIPISLVNITFGIGYQL
jgi:hypothetical protein